MKKGLFLSLIAAVALLASCNKSLPNPEQLSVNPNPLVKVGDKVDADITGTFPEKKFAKKGVLVVTPVLKYAGKEAVGEAAFEPEMAKSELWLRFEARVGNKTIEIPEIKVADGVVVTDELAEAGDNELAATPDKFQRIIQEYTEADLMFLIQSANLRSSETRSDDVKALQAAIKDANADEKKAINNTFIVLMPYIPKSF